MWAKLCRKPDPTLKIGQEQQARLHGHEFKALQDVSFEVKQGEILGIIGRNGAGKSTLLKILSRVTSPTSGEVRVKGRIASLLEVGTGFHPELTGRENIFLNGAILGMSKQEIRTKFDEIVAFSGVEDFIDTPVKRYSSGMYVRLAFAVAAHLEPEILIVDEVLAVGDADFQKKCLGKMRAVSHSGKTVLIVSHNMQTIRHLCSQALVFNQGKLRFSGPVHQAISEYTRQSTDEQSHGVDLSNYPRGAASDGARLTRVELLDINNRPVEQLERNSTLKTVIHFQVEKRLPDLDIPMALVHVEGDRVFSECYSDQLNKETLEPGKYIVEFQLPLRYLKLESYFLVVGIFSMEKQCDFVEGLPLPELIDTNSDPFLEARRWGVVRLPVSWTHIKAITR